MPLRKLEQLFENTHTNKYKKGQILLHAGEELNNFHYIQRGYVKMYGITDQGEERILLIFYPHTIFPILPNPTYSSNHKVKYFYQSLTDAELLQISRNQLNELMDQNEEVARLALDYVTQMSADLVGRLGIIESKDAKSKITNLLQYLVKTCSTETKPGYYRVNFRITHQDIASLTGLSRETSSIQINQLENEGAIVKNKSRYFIIYKPKIPVQ